MSEKEIEKIIYGREQREHVKKTLLEAVRSLHIYEFLGVTMKALLIDAVSLFCIGTDFHYIFEDRNEDNDQEIVNIPFSWNTGLKENKINLMISIPFKKLDRLRV